jgi:hypothetical protein
MFVLDKAAIFACKSSFSGKLYGNKNDLNPIHCNGDEEGSRYVIPYAPRKS